MGKLKCFLLGIFASRHMTNYSDGGWNYMGHKYVNTKDPKNEYWDYWVCKRCGHERGANGNASICWSSPLKRK